MFFADRYFGYDDAIYASCRLIEILVRAGRPLSVLLSDLPTTSVTPEIRVDCPDTVKFDLVKKVQARLLERAKSGNQPKELTIREVITIDGVRVVFEDGWGLIRASNTQPALVLRFEASSPDRLTAIRTMIETELADQRRSLAI
jgi:phosphomannomutase/phosphoglucomutase